jgi:glutathione synthase/RimK-type ligase-like ATP-grasp enzyme
VVDEFASASDVTHILAVAGDLPSLARRGITTAQDKTGFSFEMPIEGDVTLEALSRRVYETVGIENDYGDTFRFRRYAVGESHPLHLDNYRIGESNLLATALLYLTDTEEGGETHFPRAQPEPIMVKPRRGRLVVWFNHKSDGQADQASLHESLPVKRGEKATITMFIYRPLSDARIVDRYEFTDRVADGSLDLEPPSAADPTADGVRAPAISGRRPRARFFCVNDDVPAETIRLLRESCEKRDVEFLEIQALQFDYASDRRLAEGDLLYRPAVSVAAMRVEQFLHNKGVATFYANPDQIFYGCITSPLLFERAGLPIPRTIYCSTNSRKMLRNYVERLGGFPIVVKLLGAEGGVGVMRVDSFAALFSQMDYARACGNNPLLCEFIDQAVHWRLIVIGDQVVAGYRNITEPDDFRTYAGDDLSDYQAPIDPEMADIAVRAVRELKYEFGGVDLLRAPSGQTFLLEANFPCYFPQAQMVAGIDISGMMVDHLLEKAERTTVAETVISKPGL